MSQAHETHRPTPSFRRRFLSLPTVVSFAVAGAFLFFLVTRFDVNLSATWEHLRSSNKLLFLLAFVVHYTTFFFRGARWRLLLRNAQQPGQQTPSTLHCSSLILLGWFINSVTWFRMGDAYRAYAFSEDTDNTFSRTAGTILAERILDVVLVFLLLMVSTLWLLAYGVGISWFFVGLAALLMGGLAVVLLLMWRFRSALATLLPNAVGEAYRNFHQGALGSFQQLPIVTGLGLMGWLAEVSRLFLVAQALGFPLSVPLAIFVTLANAMLTLVPITPGGLGIVEPGIIGVLRITLTQSAAVSIAALDRSISWASVIFVGAIFFVARQMWKRGNVTQRKALVSK